MVGIAVPMIMLSSMASSMAIMSAMRTTRTLRGFTSPGASACLTVSLMSTPLAPALHFVRPGTYLPPG